MQSRYFDTNITKATFSASRIEGVCGDNVRCCSGGSLILCVINLELTVSSAWLTAPPPRLTINKYCVSQDSIAFRDVLSLVVPARVSSCTRHRVAAFGVALPQ